MAVNSKRGASNMRMLRTVKKVAQGTPVSVAMRESGYSALYAKDPQNLVRTETFQRLLNENGLSLDSVSKVHHKLLNSKREEIQQRAVETAYKVHGVYERKSGNTFNAPVLIQITPPTERTHVDERVEIVEREEGTAEQGGE